MKEQEEMILNEGQNNTTRADSQTEEKKHKRRVRYKGTPAQLSGEV